MGHVTSNTPLYGCFVILRLGYESVYLFTKFEDSSFSQSRVVIGARKILNALRDPDHVPFAGYLSSICWDFTHPTCVQKLITLASAVSEIWLVPTKI